ncbi:MAG TPA: hypothetical protein VLX68_16415 [Chitinivibrionales bacterium]|nr:hypothetical protein [Chitinivibrionales bacterium]
MKTIKRHKWHFAQCIAAALVMFFAAAFAYPQCNLNDNGYVFLHPAFANRNWGKAWYDSVSIVLPDTLCAARPVRFDICGPAAGAVALYSDSANGLYLMKTQYTCPQPKPLCTTCILEYLDPLQLALPGVALAQNFPLYLVKSPLYGGDSIKVLVKNTQKKVVALALSTSSLAVLHQDTLATSALLPQQDIFRIQGAYDTLNQRDSGVWLLGSSGLMRYFPIANGQWGAEAKRDLNAVSDTVLCVDNGFAGTSSGSIYKRLGGSFVFDNQPCPNIAIRNIYPRGAVCDKGTFLDYTGTSWNAFSRDTTNYFNGNFINRWDGFGVELLDNQWHRSAYTYRLNPSSISATQPAAAKFYVNNGCYRLNQPDSINVILQDPDASFTDFSIILNNAGTKVNMKNDGTYTISTFPPDSQCTLDSLRMKSGTLAFAFSMSSVKVYASCELGKRDVVCLKCIRADYPFVTSHAWSQNDTLTITAGSDVLKIANEMMSVTANGFAFSAADNGAVFYKIAGRSLMFFVHQGLDKKLVRINVYNVAGQMLASLAVGNQASVAMPHIAGAGVAFAKYHFSDGSSCCQQILLVR